MHLTFIQTIVLVTATCLAKHSPELFFVAVYSSFAIVALRFSFAKDKDWRHFAKLTCLLPLGLGSLVAFRVFAYKQYSLAAFSAYVNLAVLGNIAMMMFVPNDSPVTLRASGCKLICMGLVIWLWLEIQHVGFWETCEFSHNGLFLFKASPLKWIIVHAIYRFSLITLPCFETPTYTFMEFFSLCTMLALYWMDDMQHPIETYFGYADSIVTACIGITSALIPHNTAQSSFPTHRTLDLYLVPVQFLAICYIAFSHHL